MPRFYYQWMQKEDNEDQRFLNSSGCVEAITMVHCVRQEFLEV